MTQLQLNRLSMKLRQTEGEPRNCNLKEEKKISTYQKNMAIKTRMVSRTSRTKTKDGWASSSDTLQ